MISAICSFIWPTNDNSTAVEEKNLLKKTEFEEIFNEISEPEQVVQLNTNARLRRTVLPYVAEMHDFFEKKAIEKHAERSDDGNDFMFNDRVLHLLRYCSRLNSRRELITAIDFLYEYFVYNAKTLRKSKYHSLAERKLKEFLKSGEEVLGARYYRNFQYYESVLFAEE